MTESRASVAQGKTGQGSSALQILRSRASSIELDMGLSSQLRLVEREENASKARQLRRSLNPSGGGALNFRPGNSDSPQQEPNAVFTLGGAGRAGSGLNLNFGTSESLSRD